MWTCLEFAAIVADGGWRWMRVVRCQKRWIVKPPVGGWGVGGGGGEEIKLSVAGASARVARQCDQIRDPCRSSDPTDVQRR